MQKPGIVRVLGRGVAIGVLNLSVASAGLFGENKRCADPFKNCMRECDERPSKTKENDPANQCQNDCNDAKEACEVGPPSSGGLD